MGAERAVVQQQRTAADDALECARKRMRCAPLAQAAMTTDRLPNMLAAYRPAAALAELILCVL